MRTRSTPAAAWLLSAAACLTWAPPVAAADTYRPQIGQPHPDFVLPRIDNGKPTSLSQFRGKKVLLVHFASW